MNKFVVNVFKIALLFFLTCGVQASQVRIKDISRFDGIRDNALVGYGLVVGLSGTGDRNSNKSTLHSIRNTLENFGVIVSENDIKSRNVAAVIITASMPAFGHEGDKIDVVVSSLGDATSLNGGTLLMAPLKAANNVIYALAQGVLSVGGYNFSSHENMIQKNHPTVGRILQGATLEKSINNQYVMDDGSVQLVLAQPDFTTVSHITTRLINQFPQLNVYAINAGRISLSLSKDDFPINFPINLLAKIENTLVVPAELSRVVVNERTGIIVSGTDVMIGNVVISYGSLKLVIETDYSASQPFAILGRIPNSIKTEVLTDTTISIDDKKEATYVSEKQTTIATLVQGLKKLNLTTRDIISILQALKQSGALHAELIIQ